MNSLSSQFDDDIFVKRAGRCEVLINLVDTGKQSLDVPLEIKSA
jgi:hypothetical protein